MQKALVTGGAGFIGSHVADRFAEVGYSVDIIDDLSTGKAENVAAHHRLHVVDVGSAEAVKLIAEGNFNVIAHLAAQIDVRRSVAAPRADATTNILGTLNILEAVHASKDPASTRVVFASTGGALYGEGVDCPTPETTPANPDSPYGIAKLSAEHYLAYYARIWKLDTVALRFGNVFGPRQNPHGEAGVIAIFLERMLGGKSLTIFGDGYQTRDYVYVSDVAEAFISVATARLPCPGPSHVRAYNIGTGMASSVRELLRFLCDVVEDSPMIEFAPARAGELRQSMLDVQKARAELGWHAKTSLRDGIRLTYEWVKRQSEESAVAPAPLGSPGGA